MSYILEALKKAEHQREIGQVPRIDSEHEAAAGNLSSRWRVLVALVLLVNAGLLLVLFWPNPAVDTPAPVAASSGSAARSGAASASLTPAPAAPVSAPPAAAPGSLSHYRDTRAGQDRSSRAFSSPAPVAAAPPARRRIPTPPSPPVVVPTTPPALPASPPSPVTPPVVYTPAPPPRSRELPVWPQVSTRIFQKLRGSLRLDVHVYSERPRDRFVLINLQKYREGERLQEGPVVDEITAEGVVLSLQGEKFLVRAQ